MRWLSITRYDLLKTLALAKDANLTAEIAGSKLENLEFLSKNDVAEGLGEYLGVKPPGVVLQVVEV